MGQTIKLLYDSLQVFSQAFYDDLLRLDFAILVFFLTGGLSLLIAALYYYVIDRPATAKLSFWLLFLGVNSFISMIAAYIITNNTIVDDYHPDPVPDYAFDLIYFSAINFVVAALFFLIFSVLLKFKSSNSSHVPF